MHIPQRQSQDEVAHAKRRSEIDILDDQIETAMRNLAFAKSPEIFEGLQQIVVDLKSQRAKLESELRQHEVCVRPTSVPDDLLERTLAKIDLLPQLADDASNLASIGTLFRQIDLQMYLRFQTVKKAKRSVNQLMGGVLTIGDVPPPVEKYSGPNATQLLKQSMKSKAPGDVAGSFVQLTPTKR